ncbi:MAG: GerMN domain-containing protein [Deltaproteobacteria bacterium]|nr:GerMN domain-containing protein [Deltaproteobacteria bacterium]
MKRALFLLTLLIFALTAGCKQKQPPSPPQPVKIVATPAYEKYFGPAPVTDKGSCFAFVIFFPSAKEPGKVVPFPFFTFDEASLRKVAVERLLSGMEIGSYKGEFLQPFPKGTRIASIAESQGMVTLTLSKEFDPAVKDKGADYAARAIILTLRQFKGVSGVRIQMEGVEKPLDVQADEGVILQPAPPRLLSVIAMRDKGKSDVEEVDAFFDRPVDVKEFRMTDKDGNPFAGETYHSVFDMAAVLKPKDAARFKAGMPVKVRWKVADRLGREAEGDNVWLLEVKEH